MKSLGSKLRGLGLTMLMLACLAGAAFAGPVHNVTVSEGPDWVKVDITGSFNYSVKHLPQGSADYRSIAVDLHPAHIAGGLEPKAVLPVDFGLVGQVRVRNLGGGVIRVYIDVINYPEYSVYRTGNGVQIGIKAFKQRAHNPAAQY
jgi:hypothetical protein